MALEHVAPGEPWDVKPLGASLPGAKTAALFKAEHLEVIRLVLAAGSVLPPHRVPGDITLQCLEGELRVEAQGKDCRLAAGQLLFLPGDALHKVSAAQDSSALLTIALLRAGT